MEPKYLLSERTVKLFFRILVGGVATFMVLFLVFGIWFFLHQKASKIADLEIKDEVKEVYQKDPHDLTWWVAVLKDGRDITLEKAMIHNLQAGDSLFKKRGEAFYLVRKSKSGKTIKYWLTQ